MEKTINLLGIRNQVVLCHTESGKNTRVPIIMCPITEQEEKSIDNSTKWYDVIRWKRSDGSIISGKNIYLYGEVDVDKEEDVDYILKYNLIDTEVGSNNWMPANFDYDTGTFTTIDRKRKETSTWDAYEWFLYNHVLIGKPKRIIIYKPNII